MLFFYDWQIYRKTYFSEDIKTKLENISVEKKKLKINTHQIFSPIFQIP